MERIRADYTAWCGERMLAGVNLAKILNEIGDSELITFINKTLSGYDKQMKRLSKLDSKVHNGKQYYAELVVRESKNYILDCSLPRDVESHLLNLMTAKHRQMLKISN